MQLQSVLLYGLFIFQFTQGLFTLTSDGCVDASGFDSCMSSVTTTVQQCVQRNCQSGTCNNYNDCGSNDPNCYSACLCGGYQSWINCALSHCWNRAYSCEFQNYIMGAVQQCDFALNINSPPYFPSLAGQPGGCSCQISVIFGIIQQYQSDVNRCVKEGGTGAHSTDCYCCGASKVLSSFTDVCPSSNLTLIEPIFNSLDNFNSAFSTLNSTRCTNAFAQGLDCTAANLGFKEYNNSQFYAFPDLPSFGNAPVTDLPGQLEAPLAATTTWQFISGGPAATAVAATGSGIGIGSGSMTASASVQPTKVSNGEPRSQGQTSLVAAVGCFAMLALFGA